jgi:hypothetical protein
MFDWFRKKAEEPLVFTDNRAAFEHACTHLPNRILIEAVLPAIVEEEGRRGRDGERFFRIILAGPAGGRELWACTLAEATDWPEIGDLVGFRVVTLADDMAPDQTPVGYIACVFAPVLAGRKGWQIARNLTPANIRQAIRY